MSDRVAELFQTLSRWYEGMLRRVLKHSWAVVIVAAVAFVGAVALMATFQSESTPDDDRGAVRIVLQGPEGASLSYMDGYARQLEDIIEQEARHGDIQRYNIRVPGGGGGGGVGEVNRAQAFVVLNDWDKRDRSRRRDRRVAAPEGGGDAGRARQRGDPDRLQLGRQRSRSRP